MSKISCDICKDLIPLVKDEISTEDSRNAVKEHIKTCESCRKLYGDESLEQSRNPDLDRELEKLKRRLQIFSTVLMMFGVFFGLSLTASEEMFYNSLVMPVIGGLGYVIFGWKAAYLVPGLLFLMQCLLNFFGMARGMEYVSLMEIVMWIGIYSIFVELGVVIAGLLHFAFRKER